MRLRRALYRVTAYAKTRKGNICEAKMSIIIEGKVLLAKNAAYRMLLTNKKGRKCK